MKKYKMTEAGRTFFNEDYYDVDIWTKADFINNSIDRKAAVGLGLFKKTPERIELGFQGSGYTTIEKCNDEFSMEQFDIMEHAINGEYDQIKEVWEFMIRMTMEFEDRFSKANFISWINIKIKELEE